MREHFKPYPKLMVWKDDIQRASQASCRGFRWLGNGILPSQWTANELSGKIELFIPGQQNLLEWLTNFYLIVGRISGGLGWLSWVVIMGGHQKVETQYFTHLGGIHPVSWGGWAGRSTRREEEGCAIISHLAGMMLALAERAIIFYFLDYSWTLINDIGTSYYYMANNEYPS